MKNKHLALAVFLIFVLYSLCGHSQTIASKVDELLASRSAMLRFADLLAKVPLSERSKLFCIEQLYLVGYPDDQNLLAFSEYGSSWNFVERSINMKFSYLVYPNLNGMDPKEAVLVATPRAVQISPGQTGRVILSHSLDILTLGENEFHARVARQTLMKR